MMSITSTIEPVAWFEEVSEKDEIFSCKRFACMRNVKVLLLLFLLHTGEKCLRFTRAVPRVLALKSILLRGWTRADCVKEALPRAVHQDETKASKKKYIRNDK